LSIEASKNQRRPEKKRRWRANVIVIVIALPLPLRKIKNNNTEPIKNIGERGSGWDLQEGNQGQGNWPYAT